MAGREILVAPFWLPNLPCRIKLRRQHANQQFLPVTRRDFRRAFIPFNAPDLVQQADDPARQPFWISDAIIREPFPEIPRLADI